MSTQTQTQTEIRRYRNGSIHVEHYMHVGRQMRSRHLRVGVRLAMRRLRRLVAACRHRPATVSLTRKPA